MCEWYVPLSGPAEALVRMTKVFISPELRVTSDGAGYYLWSRRFNNLTRPIDVLHAADALLPPLVAIMNIYGGLVGRVQAAGAFWRDEHGHRHGIGVASGTARILSADGLERLTRLDSSGATLADRLCALPERDPRVRRALREMYAADPDWARLYVLLELVASDLRRGLAARAGEWDAIALQGWADAGILTRLKQTANHHRHGKHVQSRPDRISLDEARHVARAVLWRWLEAKAEAAPRNFPESAADP